MKRIKNIVNIYHQDADFDLVFSSIQNKSKLSIEENRTMQIY